MYLYSYFLNIFNKNFYEKKSTFVKQHFFKGVLKNECNTKIDYHTSFRFSKIIQ